MPYKYEAFYSRSIHPPIHTYLPIHPHPPTNPPTPLKKKMNVQEYINNPKNLEEFAKSLECLLKMQETLQCPLTIIIDNGRMSINDIDIPRPTGKTRITSSEMIFL